MRREQMVQWTPYFIGLSMLLGAVVMGLARGAPAVVLWLAFAMLSGAVLLFWESLKAVLDPTAPGDDVAEGDEEGVPAELEARKRAALRALRDIEFERAIQRLSEEDYKALEKKYRAEARAAMAAIEQGLGPWLKKAEGILERETTLDGAASKTPENTAESKNETAADAPAPTTDGATAVAPEAARVKAPEAVTDPLRCAKCETVNDADAVFCKKCGMRVQGAVDAN